MIHPTRHPTFRSSDPAEVLATLRARRSNVIDIEPELKSWTYAERHLNLGVCSVAAIETRACRFKMSGKDESVTMIALVRGSLRILNEGQTTILNGPRSVLFMPGSRREATATRHCELIELRIARSALRRALANYGRKIDLKTQIDQFALDPELDGLRRFDEALRLMLDWTEQGDPILDYPQSHRHAQGELILMLVARILATQQAKDVSGDADRAGRHPALAAALHYIETNFSQPIAMEELSNAAGVSLRTLQMLFRKTFDSTLSDYIRDYRLARAHERLNAPRHGDNVSSIARFSGFDHLGDFASVFRAKYGVRPSDLFRRAVRGQSPK